jgi:hypothetical protein
MKGLTLVELVVALGVTLIVCALAAVALADAAAAFAWQPATAELAARARAASRALTADLAAAGAGPRASLPPAVDPAAPAPPAGPRLRAWMPPILPRVIGLDGADPDTAVFDDRLSIVRLADGAPQAAVRRVGGALRWVPGPPCPALVDGCGFTIGRAVLALERVRGFRLVEVSGVDADAIQLVSGESVARGGDALLAEADVVSWRFDRARGELLRGRAGGRGQPMVDHVAGFAVEYWGDAEAPGAAPVPLAPASLADGPWIGEAPWRVDADLFRVRRVRIRLRLEAEAPQVRGRDPRRFASPGQGVSASREVSDLDLTIDVAPVSLRGTP